MTESMIVEAIRAAGGTQSTQFDAANAVGQPTQVADPSAVSRFEAAMGTQPVPFASEVSASWRAAQENNQGILHRIRALSEMNNRHNMAALELMELQYEVMNLSFQQQVVAKVADKSSNAIQTLVKNQ